MKNLFVQLLLVLFFALGSVGITNGEEFGGEWVIVQGKNSTNAGLTFFIPEKYLTANKTLVCPALLVVFDETKETYSSFEVADIHNIVLDIPNGLSTIRLEIGDYFFSKTIIW